MATAESLPRVQRVTSWADKAVLGIVFIVGAGGIVLLKVYGLPRLLISLLPGALMLFYFGYILQSRRFRLRDDVAGDNLYYLGFLYTLTSLAYALYAFAGRGEAPTEVVTEFGVALVTTILGILLRVIAIQLREDPVEIEREARLELAEAARHLRGVLSNVVLEMNHFRRQMVQSVEEGMAAVADTANKSVTDTTERFREVADTLLKHMEATADARGESTKRLNDLAANTIAAFEVVIERIKRIEPPSDLIERKLAPAVEKIEQAAEAARARASAGGDELKNLSGLVSKAIAATHDFDRRVSGIFEVFKAVDALGVQMAGLTTSLAKQEPLIAANLEGHYQALNALKETAQARAKEATESFATAIAAQERRLEALWRNLDRQPEEAAAALSSAVQEHAGALRELTEGLATMMATLRAHNDALGAELDRSRGLTLELQGNLVELAETVTRRLG